MTEYIIIHKNSTIFGMDKKGLLKEIEYLIEHNNTPLHIMTKEQWKDKMTN